MSAHRSINSGRNVKSVFIKPFDRSFDRRAIERNRADEKGQ